jgi:single-strand DNA-binding protein
MSYQQLTVVGHLGRDPEMRYTPTGVPVTSFSVAVSRNWTDQNGQRQEKTTWFRVSAWRKLAEIVSQYATKGQLVLVSGEIDEPRIWTDKDGNARVSLEMTAQTFRLLGGRPDGSRQDLDGSSSERSYEGAGSGGSSSSSSSSGGSDEDIPF